MKVSVIQAMIQIERPTGWRIDEVRKLAMELKCIEIFSSGVDQSLSVNQSLRVAPKRWLTPLVFFLYIFHFSSFFAVCDGKR